MEPNDEKRRPADPSDAPPRSLQDDIFKQTLAEVREHSRLVFEHALKLNQEAYHQVTQINLTHSQHHRILCPDLRY